MGKNEFLSKDKELYDSKIIEALKVATKDYENGAICECADTLREIVYAVDSYVHFWADSNQ